MGYFERTKTYHALNPFRGRKSDYDNQCFMHSADDPYLRKGSSIKGRAICLLKLVLQPLNLILKIARKIAKVAAWVFLTLGIALRVGHHSYGSSVARSFREFIDHLGSLAVTPFAQTVATVRYLFGIIHPGFVFGFR